MAEPATLDLLNDEYWIVTWPGFTLLSTKFPYLVIRMAGGIYAPVKARENYPDQLALIEWAQKQATQYHREACLILAPKHCYYIHSPNKILESDVPAMGGTVISFEKWRLGEILEGKIGSPPRSVFWTENPQSEVPSVSTTNERIEIKGLESKINVN
jgi:hypothetical protein